MKIEIELKIDERKQKPYWMATVTHGDSTFIQVVSQTFDESIDTEMKHRYHNVCTRTLIELFNRINSNDLKNLFLTQNKP